MSLFRSRKNGHKHVTVGGWLGAVVFASLLPSAVGLLYILVGVIFGKLDQTEDTVVSVIAVSGTLMAVGIFYAWAAVLVAGSVALLFLRAGWGGWAVPVLVGAAVTATLGVLITGSAISLIMGVIGATYGIFMWWGLAMFCPEALRESHAPTGGQST